MSKSLWKNEYYVQVYIQACQGTTEKEIAESLGMSQQLLNHHKHKDSALQDALERGNKRKEEIHTKEGDVNSFKNYIYRQLPPKLRSLWEQLKDLSIKKRFKKKAYLLKMETEEVQKHLFVYALCARNFNPSRACRSIGIPYSRLERWMKEADFKQLLDQIEIHRNNFFEEALVKKVKEGDTSAVLFVNRTRNRDRGYGDKTQVEINGKIEHQHTHLIEIDKLPLSLDVKKAILVAIREQREEQKKLGYAEAEGIIESKVINGKAIPVEEKEKEYE